MTLDEEITEAFAGENGWLIDNPQERLEEVIKFINEKVNEAVEDERFNSLIERYHD